MPKRRKIILILLSAILLLSVIAVAYAYFAVSVTNNSTPVSVTSTQVANLTMTAIAPSSEAPMIPGWVSYQGIDVQATGSGTATYDLTLEIAADSHIKNDIQIAICKKEDQTSAIAANEFTYTAGSMTYNTSVTPAQQYIGGSNAELPASNCTNVLSATTLNTLGTNYLISSGSGKTLQTNKHDKYYIIYKYLNRDSVQVQGETFTITPHIEPLAKSSVANAPKLVDNLIPVVYNESTSKWVMVSSSDANWYDYDAQKWANAVTVKEAKRGTYSVGDTIEMEDILGMWVWIPRFEYKYTNLGTNYAEGTQLQPGAISINFVRGTSTNETTGYIIHPAFRDASSGYTNNAGTFTAYQIGGWDSELTGFWMGKFETSSLASASGTSSTVLNDPIVKPNVVARRYQKVAHQYQTAQNIKTYHGISTLDSHMSKNSEWGAVTYLSQSDYGKYGNSDYSGANKEIYMNNSGLYYTGGSMGLPSGASGGSATAEGSYQYYVAINGTGASTTGNIYGIYDMVGGSWERQMGWLNTASTNFGYNNNEGTDTNGAGFTSAPSNHKYYEEYTTTDSSTACGGMVCYGQALSETEGWYGDYQNMVSTEKPWFIRGGTTYNYKYNGSGVFSFYNSPGDYSTDTFGVRAVLV